MADIPQWLSAAHFIQQAVNNFFGVSEWVDVYACW